MSSSRLPEHSLNIFRYRRNPNIAHFASLAENDFHSTFGNLLPHSNSKRDTDQIRVLELHSRTLIAVVEHHIQARSLEGIRDVFRNASNPLVLHIAWSHHDLKRSNRCGQPESIL